MSARDCCPSDEDVLDLAIAAAMQVVEDATDDAAEEDALWCKLVVEAFTQHLRLLESADADTFAALVNERLARDYVPWRITSAAIC